MKRLMFLAAMTAAMPIAAVAQSKVETQPYENYIQVTGRAEKEVVPDEIYIKIVLDENSPTKKMAIDKQERELTTGLKSIGIDIDKDLSVTNLSGGHKTYILKKNQGVVTKTYQLKVGSAAKLAEVYRKLDGLDISNVSVNRVDHSKMKELGNELKVESVKDAQAQAQVLAQAIGQKAGRAIMIVEYGYMGVLGAEVNDNQYLTRSKVSAMGGGEAEQESSIEFRKLKLSYSVQVKFVLE